MFENIHQLDNDQLKKHFYPKKGWINDPNGLVYFNGYYHAFYQHLQNHEFSYNNMIKNDKADFEAMVWGHARSKDLVNWEEMPIALYADKEYDADGVWSGTAIVKDGRLYVFYAAIYQPDKDGFRKETICMAYSDDGINFTKYQNNPLISPPPKKGGSDFRDPAVIEIDGIYYMIVATGNQEEKKGRLLLYKSNDLVSWEYKGVVKEWDGCKFCECPSVVKYKDKYLVTTSVVPLDNKHYFTMMLGDFINDKFVTECVGSFQKGPDQYAGQIFNDDKGRAIFIAWVSGWHFQEWHSEKCLGCLSTAMEIKVEDGKFFAYPVEEAQNLLVDRDENVKFTDKGFVVERKDLQSIVYEGKIKELKIIKDEYVLEIFVNGGEYLYTIILC